MILRGTFLKSKGEIIGRALHFLTREEGATAPEYALMAGLVAGVIVLAVTIFGINVNKLFQIYNGNYPK